MTRLLVTLAMIMAVLAGGCSDDPDSCFPPTLIRLYCAEEPASDPCDCNKGPMRIEAYVDLARLPAVNLTASTDGYGRTPVGLYCPEFGPGRLEINHDPEYPDQFWPPVIVRINDAFIVTEMQPGNGVSIPTWRVEIESLDQASFWVLRDGVEIPIQP